MKITLSHEAKESAAELLPAHMVKSVIGYFEEGYSPGDFLRAILENNLMNACLFADDRNINALPRYMEWLRWHVPGRPYRWGSHEAVQQHLRECYEQNEHPETA